MVRRRDIEQIFLYILQEDGNREEINKRIQCFNDNDWQRLFELVTTHGLFPIFYSRLLSLKLENIPAEFLSRLKNAFFLNLRRNILLEEELLEILSYFKKLNIPLIPLKGPILARYLYSDSALRQTSGDLDLLIEQERIQEIMKKLEEIGYFFDCEQGKADFFYKFRKQITLQKHHTEGLGGIELDLHWDFRNRYINSHIKDFWLNSKHINLDGYQALAFSNESLLLYLTLTSITDFDFIQIKYLYDVHRLITMFGKDINWESLINKAKHFNFDSAFFFALKLSRDLFNTHISRELSDALKPGFIKENLCKLWINKNNILRHREKIASTYIWRHFISSFIYSEDIFDAIKIIYKRIFLPKEEVAGFYNHPGVSYTMYIKRLLKPFMPNLAGGRRK